MDDGILESLPDAPLTVSALESLTDHPQIEFALPFETALTPIGDEEETTTAFAIQVGDTSHVLRLTEEGWQHAGSTPRDKWDSEDELLSHLSLVNQIAQVAEVV
jgi:hypothetical protein